MSSAQHAPGAAAAGEREPGGIKLALTLGLAGLISGLALVAVYEVTLPIIERNKAEALRRAVFKVVPGSRAMQKLVQAGGSKLKVAGAKSHEPGVYGAYDGEGKLLGYAIEGEGPGFQDTIRLLFGYDPRRERIIGMEVLESRETPGLGDRIYKDEDFGRQFSDLAVKPKVVVVKHGTKTQPNQIDAITGATISSKAVGRIVDGACRRWLSKLPDPARAPPLEKSAGSEEKHR